MTDSLSRQLLIVAGMHRSGTSALCAALESVGASFGSELLEPMEGVNAEGFWEDRGIVQINQELLRRLDASWYSVPSDVMTTDWSSGTFEDLRTQAAAILERGFGEGSLEVVKDPRFCITLPFWLEACDAVQLPATVCVINRAPLEVARSLQARDGFPLGYGLRLYARYRQCLEAALPASAHLVTYDALIDHPVLILRELAASLPLTVPGEDSGAAVKADLRHHDQLEGDPLLLEADQQSVDLAELYAVIDRCFPFEETLAELARAIVDRGEQLTRLGEEHAVTLSTLRQRDADLQGLSEEHRQALATIDERDAQIDENGEHLARALATLNERDGQIEEFDRRLSKLGEEHSYALDLIRTRDAQLQRVFATPVLGPIFRAMWKRESR